jgi:hypothetical protein
MERTDTLHRSVEPRPIVENAQGGTEVPTPLHRPQPRREPGQIAARSTQHPEELVITGITTMCGRCGARRDWLLVCVRDEVSITCRCGHQWVEPEITRADFDALINTPGQVFDSLEEVSRVHGFDGTLAGTYFLEPRRC